MAPGALLYEAHLKFMDWAGAYDEGDESMRSLRRHESWLTGLTCPVIRFDGVCTVEQQLKELKPYLAKP